MEGSLRKWHPRWRTGKGSSGQRNKCVWGLGQKEPCSCRAWKKVRVGEAVGVVEGVWLQGQAGQDLGEHLGCSGLSGARTASNRPQAVEFHKQADFSERSPCALWVKWARESPGTLAALGRGWAVSSLHQWRPSKFLLMCMHIWYSHHTAPQQF